MIRIIRIITIFLTIISVLISTQDSDNETTSKSLDQERENIRRLQRQHKEEIKIQKTTYKTYNFKIQGHSDFILKPINDQQISATIDVYWNQQNVYMMANVDKKQYLEVKVIREKSNILVNQIFYTTTGFKFNATAQQQYRIAIQEKGKIVKMLALHLSQKILPSNTTAKKLNMMKAQMKMMAAQNKLKHGMQMSKLASLMDRGIDDQVLRKTWLYSYFQIFEILLIALGSWIQVHLVIRLLKIDSII